MKAHIARNQNAGVPLALGWNLSAADRGILEGNVHLRLLHEVQQGVEVFFPEVCQHQRRRIGPRLQHEGA